MESLFYKILIKHGYENKKAKTCAEVFAKNSLDGVYTHGVNRFIRFVKHIRQRYPEATICLINSSEFTGDTRNRFAGYLESTIGEIKKSTGDEKLYTFSFSCVYGKGCTGHPTIKEHKAMANELRPYLKKIMGW